MQRSLYVQMLYTALEQGMTDEFNCTMRKLMMLIGHIITLILDLHLERIYLE